MKGNILAAVMQWPYSKHLQTDLKARVFVPGKPFQPSVM